MNSFLPLKRGRIKVGVSLTGFRVQAVQRLLIRVAGGDVAGDLGAFFQIAMDDNVGGGRAAAVGLLKAAIAAIETRDHLLAARSARRCRIWCCR